MLTINKLRKVAYPKEHGSWGFLIEPLLLALLVAYTNTGLLLALSTFVIFLAHQPVRILLNNHDKVLKQVALIVLVVYSALVVFLLSEIFSQVEYEILFPFAIAIAMMFFFLILELLKLGRYLIVEFIAPVAISLIGLNIALFDGWTVNNLIAFEIVLLSRAIPTVLYVNVKLLFFKKLKTNLLPLRISEVFFLAITIILFIYCYIPFLSIIAVLMFITRSYIGLLPRNKNENVKKLGIKEFIFGFSFVIINAIGYLLNI